MEDASYVKNQVRMLQEGGGAISTEVLGWE